MVPKKTRRSMMIPEGTEEKISVVLPRTPECAKVPGGPTGELRELLQTCALEPSSLPASLTREDKGRSSAAHKNDGARQERRSKESTEQGTGNNTTSASQKGTRQLCRTPIASHERARRRIFTLEDAWSPDAGSLIRDTLQAMIPVGVSPGTSRQHDGDTEGAEAEGRVAEPDDEAHTKSPVIAKKMPYADATLECALLGGVNSLQQGVLQAVEPTAAEKETGQRIRMSDTQPSSETADEFQRRSSSAAAGVAKSPAVHQELGTLQQVPRRPSNVRKKRPFYKDHELRVAVGFVVCSIVLFTYAAVLLIEWNHIEISVPGVGKVRGCHFFVERRRMYSFLGLHFSLSTAGKRRFMRPIAAVRAKQVIDATARKPGCIQKMQPVTNKFAMNNTVTTEDCLHLNIWTPCTAVTEPGCRKTVIVFFFATGFQNGDNNIYDASYLSALGDVVVVTPNFRLGIFGFLGAPGSTDVPANVALYDQQLAMEWVLNHIQYFGGNRSNVVPMGSGSGSWSIGAQLLSTNPFWRHHFSRFIFQSESPFRRYFPSRPDIGPLVGCPYKSDDDLISCLRSVPAATIIDITRNPLHFFGPTYTDDLLPEPPWELATKTDIHGKDVFLGVVSDEGCYLASRLLTIANNSTLSLADVVLSVYNIEHMDEFVEAYAKRHEPGTWASKLLADMLFVCPMLSFATHLSFKGNRVRAFVFDHGTSYTTQPHCSGAGAYDLLDFVFGKPVEDPRIGTSDEAALSRRVIDMWTGFAKTGELPTVRDRPWPNFSATERFQVRIRAKGLGVIAELNDSTCAEAAKFLPELDNLRRENDGPLFNDSTLY